ncbi:MAG: hypothetical protein ACTSPB_19195, partial [Candidatus Thorarchaeota archaeon]
MKGQVQYLLWFFVMVVIILFTFLGLQLVTVRAGHISAKIETADNERKAELLYYVLTRDPRFTTTPGVIDASAIDEWTAFVTDFNLGDGQTHELPYPHYELTFEPYTYFDHNIDTYFKNDPIFTCKDPNTLTPYEYYYSFSEPPLGFCSYDYLIHIKSDVLQWYGGTVNLRRESCDKSNTDIKYINPRFPDNVVKFYSLIDYEGVVYPATVEISVFDLSRTARIACLFTKALLWPNTEFTENLVSGDDNLRIMVRFLKKSGVDYIAISGEVGKEED